MFLRSHLKGAELLYYLTAKKRLPLSKNKAKPIIVNLFNYSTKYALVLIIFKKWLNEIRAIKNSNKGLILQ